MLDSFRVVPYHVKRKWETLTESTTRQPRIPPRWFVRAAWAAHRALYATTRGKVGVWLPKPGRWGALQLTTIGRRSGKNRSVIVGYIMDGSSFIVAAMNGWGAADPAWWLNLQSNPTASVIARDWRGLVHASEATGVERQRLWALWTEIEPKLDGYVTLRPGPTALVVLQQKEAV